MCSIAISNVWPEGGVVVLYVKQCLQTCCFVVFIVVSFHTHIQSFTCPINQLHVCVQIPLLYGQGLFIVVNPRRACAARVTVLVCLSVDAYSGTTGYEAANKRNQRLQNHKWVKTKKAIFQKRLRSGDMA